MKYNSFPGLSFPNLICAFSLRNQGNMSLIYGDCKDSLTNRKNFLLDLGIDYRNLICAKQVHASNIRYVKEQDLGKGAISYDDAIADTDAFVTDKKNLPLAIFTADCLSIFLYDPLAPAIGLIHAGKRSTQENITAKTIQLMQKFFNTKAAGLLIGFGPAIRNCCYEIDLIAMNKREILDSGAKETNIFDSQICPSCQNNAFFSYRKEGNSSGRMLSIMMLK